MSKTTEKTDEFDEEENANKTESVNLASQPGGLAPYTLTREDKIRVECLKLTFRHDRTAEDITLKAADLEKYVLTGTPKGANVEQG